MTPLGETTRTQGLLAALLALIAGYIDAYTLLNYRVYASFMSGNTTQTGLNTGQGKLENALHNFLPIPCFVVGIVVGTLLLQSHSRRPLSKLCGLVALLLGLALAAVHGPLTPGWIFIVLLSLAMGLMNTTITHVGRQPVSLGFVTGDLNHLGRHIALAMKDIPVDDSQGPWDTHWRRAGVLAWIWGAFLFGACLSGALMTLLSHWILLPPAAILTAIAIIDLGPKPLR